MSTFCVQFVVSKIVFKKQYHKVSPRLLQRTRKGALGEDLIDFGCILALILILFGSLKTSRKCVTLTISKGLALSRQGSSSGPFPGILIIIFFLFWRLPCSTLVAQGSKRRGNANPKGSLQNDFKSVKKTLKTILFSYGRPWVPMESQGSLFYGFGFHF